MASLYVLQGPDKGRTFQVHDRTTVLGRRSEQVPLSDHAVSRRHSELRANGQSWQIVDLGSANGTYVNGERIPDQIKLQHGDQIKIGSTLLVFRVKAGEDEYLESRADQDVIDVAGADGMVDSSVLSSIQASEQSVILAAPETAEAVRAWRLMYRLAEAIGTINSIDELLEYVTDVMVEHLPVERVFIMMRDEAKAELTPAVVRYHRKQRGRRERITTSRAIINRVIDTKSGILCANATADKRFAGDAKTSSLQSLALRSVICVPVIAHDEVQGIIHLDCPMSQHTYTHDQLRVATAIGQLVGMAIENQRLLEARMRNERLAATGETVAHLSHHIRNILQGLRSGADVVDVGLSRESTEKITIGWRIVQHNLERIFQLTTDMLTFSKDREPRIEMSQINGIVDDAVTLARHRAEERGTVVDTQFDDLPAVPVDPEGIHQAVFNLIINGIAACPTDKGRIDVSTRFDADADRVHLRIRDNGPGIPRDQIKHLFLPFHSSKGQGGTGLGLAAAKKIVDELGGEITVDTAKGRGTTFEIVLPGSRPGSLDKEKTHGAAR